MEDNKEFLLELAKQLISKEEIKNAVREVVRDRLDYHVDNELRQIVHDILHEKGEGYITEMINEALSRPVKKDDGWGHVERYDSFENFVRDQIKQKSYDRSAWELELKIRRCVENKIKEVAKDLAEQEAKDRSAAILKELATETAEVSQKK